MYMCSKMVNRDDGVDYDATSMLIMNQIMMTATPDAMMVMVIRDEDDDHPR